MKEWSRQSDIDNDRTYKSYKNLVELSKKPSKEEFFSRTEGSP